MTIALFCLCVTYLHLVVFTSIYLGLVDIITLIAK
ncbi:MAG: hypothetical protein JWN30_1248 [Bacilli bacterium]|nr:hypothetical protein [Bacilli bacterium]